MKEFFSSKELLGVGGLPKYPSNLARLAKKENWEYRKVTGVKGGGFEYKITSLPLAVQAEIRNKMLNLLPSPVHKGELDIRRQEIDLKQISENQLNTADARLYLARWYLQQEQGGRSRNKTLDTVIKAIEARQVPQEVLQMVALANGKSNGKARISKRTLHSIVLGYEAGETTTERLKQMLPLKREVKVIPERCPWLKQFLTFYQVFSNPSISSAYQLFKKQYNGDSLPTENQVRYALKQLPSYVTQKGRKTGAEMRAIQPFIRRDDQVMELNECWVGDGHSFKAYVKNLSGVPYVPEVTAIIDVRSHRVVGWSIADSESVMAVGDAIRHGITQVGAPNIYYSDNGGGESNKMFDSDVTGILPRIGIHHEVGEAGNPQGRGIIERLWQSTLIPLAKSYESYGGKDGDNATKHLNYRKIRSAMKAKAKDKLLTDEQRRYMGKIPHFADFVEDVAACFEDYNNRPHRSLPRNPETGERFSPNGFWNYIAKLTHWQPTVITEAELSLLFRPEIERVVQRGEIHFDNKIYFSLDLADYHGQKVRVSYDIHDPKTVLVKQQTGEIICEAVLDGNKIDYFPESVRESGRRKSLEAKIRRKQDAIDILKVQHQETKSIEHTPSFSFITTEAANKAKQATPIFLTQAEKDEWEKQQIKALG